MDKALLELQYTIAKANEYLGKDIHHLEELQDHVEALLEDSKIVSELKTGDEAKDKDADDNLRKAKRLHRDLKQMSYPLKRAQEALRRQDTENEVKKVQRDQTNNLELKKMIEEIVRKIIGEEIPDIVNKAVDDRMNKIIDEKIPEIINKALQPFAVETWKLKAEACILDIGESSSLLLGDAPRSKPKSADTTPEVTLSPPNYFLSKIASPSSGKIKGSPTSKGEKTKCLSPSPGCLVFMNEFRNLRHEMVHRMKRHREDADSSYLKNQIQSLYQVGDNFKKCKKELIFDQIVPPRSLSLLQLHEANS